MARGSDRLDELARVLKSLPAKLTAATVQVAEDNAVVLELANQQQLEQGLDSTGRDITPEYTAFTVQEKQEKGQPVDRVTLRDSGAHRRRGSR